MNCRNGLYFVCALLLSTGCNLADRPDKPEEPESRSRLYGRMHWSCAAGGEETTETEDFRNKPILTSLGNALRMKDLVPESRLRKQCAERTSTSPVRFAPPAEEELSLESLYTLRAPSVFIILRAYICERCGHWHYQPEGTAFAVTADGLAVTARHVLMDSEKLKSPRWFVSDFENNVHPITEVLAADPKNDLAIFRIAGARLRPIPMRASQPPVGAPVAVIGHPNLHLFALTSGVVSRVTTKVLKERVLGFFQNERRQEFIELTAGVSPGSSGAPVMDMRGNLIGIALSTDMLNRGDTGDGLSTVSVISRCVPASRLVDALCVEAAKAADSGKSPATASPPTQEAADNKAASETTDEEDDGAAPHD